MKKVIALLLAVMVVFSFAACGKKEAEKKAEKVVVGVSLPWLGTQNYKESNDQLKEGLEKMGFKAIVQQADQKVDQQQNQITSMVANGAKVILVAPQDGKQLGGVLEDAVAQGVKVIAYDREIEGTAAVDAVILFDPYKTGLQQGQALVDGLKARKGAAPYNIELFGGGATDPNAPQFFNGAMEILKPLIDNGTLVVVSGEMDFNKVETNWDPAKAQDRMASLLSAHYGNKDIDGVLCPNDSIARAILIASEDAAKELPVTTGLDAENESVKAVWEGRQYATVYKPTEVLVGKALEVVAGLANGTLPKTDAVKNNGKKDVPYFGLQTTVVTKENAKEAFAKDAGRFALLK